VFLLGYWGRKDHRPGQQGLSRAEHLRPFATDAARRSRVCRTLKNWVSHMGKMESDFRKAKNLWTGAGEEPANQLNGEGEWQTLHQQRLNICPEWDEHVQVIGRGLHGKVRGWPHGGVLHARFGI
jgi:hypothetical protein